MLTKFFGIQWGIKTVHGIKNFKRFTINLMVHKETKKRKVNHKLEIIPISVYLFG